MSVFVYNTYTHTYTYAQPTQSYLLLLLLYLFRADHLRLKNILGLLHGEAINCL